MRLALRGAGRTMALIGRGGSVPGEAGGELAISARRTRAWSSVKGSPVGRYEPAPVGRATRYWPRFFFFSCRRAFWRAGLIVAAPSGNGTHRRLFALAEKRDSNSSGPAKGCILPLPPASYAPPEIEDFPVRFAGILEGKCSTARGGLGRPLVYLIALTGVAQITNASPEDAPVHQLGSLGLAF